MENLLCIKGKIIGKGKPLVCVPVMESSKEEILRETRRLEEAHTEMIEWRVDAFENVESPNAIREILNEMKHIIRESILVYTFRSKNQGGCKALSAADIYDIHQGADVCGFSALESVIGYLQDGGYKEPAYAGRRQNRSHGVPDFSEVNGQQFLKRAAEIAASGMHNMLMVGPPGAGKTMISERMATILPPLTKKEQLEVSKIYSVCGLLADSRTLLQERPFRSPHHTVSMAGLAGGGRSIRPGEISLAHHGVLFLDELPEFSKSTMEVLRQPLEEHQIHLTRAVGSVTYPSDFLLLASMNPCNCGYYPDRNRCRCTQASLQRYFDRISQPLIDRMDLCVEAPMVTYEELTGNGNNESSKTIRDRVCECQERQIFRFKDEIFSHNSGIPAAKLNQFCRLGEKEQRYMEKMFHKLSLTARTYHKILRVARTIADTQKAENIRVCDLTEAVCYRSIGDKFWGGMEE